MNAESFMDRFGPSVEEAQGVPASQDLSADAFINRFSGLSETYYFYKGTVEIQFDKENHIYYRIGELGEMIPTLNVSTVSKIVDRSLALIPWAAKVAIEKLLRTIPVVDGGIIMTIEDFTKLAMEAKSAHRDKLEEAGEVGKAAHDWLERYIKAVMAGDEELKRSLLQKMCFDPRSTSCAYAALTWMQAHNVRWLDTERKVYSLQHNCSGTLDGRCIVDSCQNRACCPTPFINRRTLLDWKTSNYLYTEFLFQAAAYFNFFLEEFPEEHLDDIWILRLGKEDGEFEPWHVEAEDVPVCFQGFLGCLNLKRKVTEVEQKVKDYKAVIKAIKKAQRAEEKAQRIAAEKIAKAEAKAAAKAAKAVEKERIKAEAKAERLRLKEAKKKACTLSESGSTALPNSESSTHLPTKSDTGYPEATATVLTGTLKSPSLTEPQPEGLSITSTEETECGSNSSVGSAADSLTFTTTSSVGEETVLPHTGTLTNVGTVVESSESDCMAYTPNLEEEVARVPVAVRQKFILALEETEDRPIVFSLPTEE